VTTSRRATPLQPEEIAPRTCDHERQCEVLHQVPFFAGLSHDQVAELHKAFRVRGYSAGQTIFTEGDPATHLYVVAAGKVKVLRQTLDGQDIVLDILLPGEFFGSLSTLGDELYQDSAQAHTDLCALAIDAATFEQFLLQYPPVALRVLTVVSQRLQRAHAAIRQLSVDSAESRIAATLLYLAHKMGKEWEESTLITSPLSREVLAQMSGTTPETASRVMSQFRKAGLIRSGRQWIAVVDATSLAALAPS
jgi:CRP/FNR family transcriptional regulator, nitrogen oxide reductase regulator